MRRYYVCVLYRDSSVNISSNCCVSTLRGPCGHRNSESISHPATLIQVRVTHSNANFNDLLIFLSSPRMGCEKEFVSLLR